LIRCREVAINRRTIAVYRRRVQIFHVTSRGNAQDAIFRDDLDYVSFLRMLAPVIPQFDWSCYAFCLMPNHYHLLLESTDPTISSGMHLLNGRYARRFNARHGRVGHVFQGPYHAEPVTRDEHLLEVCRYIALNPVRAALCADPGEWPWSSYDRAWPFVDTSTLQSAFGSASELRQFVSDGIERLQPG
jgi:REP element-mobilizing transposase RayT